METHHSMERQCIETLLRIERGEKRKSPFLWKVRLCWKERPEDQKRYTNHKEQGKTSQEEIKLGWLSVNLS